MAIIITFERVEGCETQLAVRLNTGVECPNPAWLAVVDCGSGIARELSLRHLQRQLAAQLAEIRRLSYAAGWRDAKRKRCKRNYFAECVEVLPWECVEAGE